MDKQISKSKKIREGDKVVAVAGNAKGQTGIVIRCIGEKVLVQGLNVVKKHVKKSEKNPRGGIIEMEKPIHVSNLKICDDEGKPLKLKIERSADGSRQLVYSQNGQQLVYRSIKSRKK